MVSVLFEKADDRRLDTLDATLEAESVEFGSPVFEDAWWMMKAATKEMLQLRALEVSLGGASSSSGANGAH